MTAVRDRDALCVCFPRLQTDVITCIDALRTRVLKLHATGVQIRSLARPIACCELKR